MKVFTLDSLAQQIHENAAAKGFWPPEGRNFGEQMALIHSEVSEALEEDRAGKPVLYYLDANGDVHGLPLTYPAKPEGALSELADVLIRTLDSMQALARPFDLSIDRIVYEKMDYNASRPVKHGKAY